jgi:hypothetical protein
MNWVIDQALSHLERAGALQDENHIFREGTSNRKPPHARRALRNMLLAAHMVSTHPDWTDRYNYVANESPDLLPSFAWHMEAVSDFLIGNAYLFIEGLDADMNGTEDLDVQFEYDLYDDMVLFLHEAILLFGPWVLVELLELETKFDTHEDFLRWLAALYEKAEPERRDGFEHGYLEYPILEDLSLYAAAGHEDRWSQEDDTFGIEVAGDLDLDRWAETIPDDEAWRDLMYSWGWIEPAKPVRELLHLQKG